MRGDDTAGPQHSGLVREAGGGRPFPEWDEVLWTPRSHGGPGRGGQQGENAGWAVTVSPRGRRFRKGFLEPRTLQTLPEAVSG